MSYIICSLYWRKSLLFFGVFMLTFDDAGWSAPSHFGSMEIGVHVIRRAVEVKAFDL